MSENNHTTLKEKTGEETITLDTVVYENKTYRDIFETNNGLGIQPGFSDGTWGSMVQSASYPLPVLTAKAQVTGAIGDYVLDVSGTPSHQLKSTTTFPATGFIASRVKCTRYAAGGIGGMIQASSSAQGLSRITSSDDDDWEVVAGIGTYTGTSTARNAYIGSYSSADLDGYLDMPVIIDLAIFTETPTEEFLVNAYKTYLEIKRSATGSIIVYQYRLLVQSHITNTDYKNSNIVISTDTYNMQIGAKPHVSCTVEQAKQAFYDEMNAEAQKLGMTSTLYSDPAGYPGKNTTTSNDVVRLGIKGMDFPAATEIWACPAKTVVTSGVVKTFNLESTIVDKHGWCDILKTDYNLLGGKTGTGASSAPWNDRLFNYVITLEAKDTLDMFTIAVNCTETFFPETEEHNRYREAKKLADIAKLLRAAGEFGITDSDNIQNADCKAAVKAIEATFELSHATVILTPPYAAAYDGKPFYTGDDRRFLYAVDGATQFPAYSTTKMMTMLVTLKWIPDLHETFEVLAEDIRAGTGPAYDGGEIITYEDALYVLMLPSSNTTGHALARVVGEKIYSVKNRL